jgi:hypothetical protein
MILNPGVLTPVIIFYTYMKSSKALFTPLFCALLALCSCKKSIDSAESLNGPVTSSDAVVTNTYYIAPKVTDATITTALSNHFASVQTGGTLKNVLYLFFPGTNRNPTNCRATTEKAASLGYHSIGLMYDNLVAGNPLCSATGDITCHSRARLEVIDGVNRHPSVNVNTANSLINRLTKLLVYLNKTRPTHGWGQYLLNGKPNWSKIIVSGHSQGGAIAGVIGRHYPIKKVVMISMIDFLNNGKIPDWVASQTNKGKYYALTNLNDELVPWLKVRAGWDVMGISAYGPRINVDWNAFPYSNTHTLITTVAPKTTMVDKYHNGTAVDSYIPKTTAGKYVYDKAWEYLINN